MARTATRKGRSRLNPPTLFDALPIRRLSAVAVKERAAPAATGDDSSSEVSATANAGREIAAAIPKQDSPLAH